jgi:hypothetical protein
MIKRPERLIKQYLCKDGEYCALGWLAKELGVRPEDELALLSAGIGNFGATLIADTVLEGIGIKCSGPDLCELANRNDRTDQADRVNTFVYWCMGKGIELHD